MQEPFEITSVSLESDTIDKILDLNEEFFTPTKYQIEILDEQDSFEGKNDVNIFYIKITPAALEYSLDLMEDIKSIKQEDLPSQDILLEKNRGELLAFLLKKEGIHESQEMREAYDSVKEEANIAYIYRRKDLDAIENKYTRIIKALLYEKWSAYFEQCFTNSNQPPSYVFNPDGSLPEKLLSAFEEDELKSNLPVSHEGIEKFLQENIGDESFCCQETIISTLVHSEYLKLEIKDENDCFQIGIFLDSGPLYKPPNYNHTWNNNLAWILAHIHRGHQIKVIPEIRPELINRKTEAHRGDISGFARELALLKILGYSMELQGTDCYLKPPPDKNYSKLTLQEARLMSNDEATVRDKYTEVVEDYKALRFTSTQDLDMDSNQHILTFRERPADFDQQENIKKQKIIKKSVEEIKLQEDPVDSSQSNEKVPSIENASKKH